MPRIPIRHRATDQKGGRPTLLLSALLLGLLGLQAIPLYTDWLWFQEIRLTQVFTTTLTTRILLGLLFGGSLFLLLAINLTLALRFSATDVLLEVEEPFGLPSRLVIEPYLRRLLFPGLLAVGLIAALQASGEWTSYLRFVHATPVGTEDPLFHKDIGFYLFHLPFLSTLYGWAMFGVAFTLLLTAATYLLLRGIQITFRGPVITRPARIHLLILGALLFVVKAYGFYLDTYDLLYSPRGAVFGAGYADIHAQLPALRLLVILSVVAALLCLVQILRPGIHLVVGGLGLLLVSGIIGLTLYPLALQRLRVAPNEIDKERQYIDFNIRHTRRAYGLDKIAEREFPAEENLTGAALRKNDLTIKNIRLWDHRPLLRTYAQLQEIRTYYKFVDVDNDRYLIDGQYRQVMLSPRELSHRSIPAQAQTWINEHFTYTHGYGVVMGPVNRISREGLPEFFIKDIPPVSTISIKITRPEIYFGELSNDYVFVKSTAQELDYPAGDQNVYSTYDGSGGIPLSSFWRKLLFAARFQTLKILLSNDLPPVSRILIHQKITERVRTAVPLLRYERDPYMVVGEDGRLFWIIDAYTVSDKYPYSEPVRGLGNYIRNSVKVVVDAYNGTLTYYLSDPTDPVIQTYAKAFPGLFHPLEKMPADLRAHIRYPHGLLATQAQMYATYHMQDPQVFYNKEDLWSIPKRGSGEGREAGMEPYYTIMRLPGEVKEEFVLLLPFTPAPPRDNMIAWLAARSDPPNYGTLVVYKFPKEKLIYGPSQIEARIDQDAFISQQLSLWGQRGSQVIRGSLLAIPIEQSLIYVEPLYLAAEQGSLPELKRVIVAYGNQIAMEENLELALSRVFGGRPAVEVSAPTGPVRRPEAASLRALTGQAWDHYTRAQEALRQGNFAAYGEEVKKLEGVLRSLREQAAR